MIKNYLFRHIPGLIAVNGCNNATCKTTTSIKVAVGWDGFLTRKRKIKMIKMELTLNTIVLCGKNSRSKSMCSIMILIKVTVGWNGFFICIKFFFQKWIVGN